MIYGYAGDSLKITLKRHRIREKSPLVSDDHNDTIFGSTRSTFVENETQKRKNLRTCSLPTHSRIMVAADPLIREIRRQQRSIQ